MEGEGQIHSRERTGCRPNRLSKNIDFVNIHEQIHIDFLFYGSIPALLFHM